MNVVIVSKIRNGFIHKAICSVNIVSILLPTYRERKRHQQVGPHDRVLHACINNELSIPYNIYCRL